MDRISHHRIEALDMEFSIVSGKDMLDCIDIMGTEFLDFPQADNLDLHAVATTVYGHTRRKSLNGDPRISIALLFPKNIDLRTIVHESTHCVWDMCQYSGIETGYDNQEVFALLTEYVFETVRKQIYVRRNPKTK
jgi:hypothetical protein